MDLVVLNEAGTLLKREINLNHHLIFSRNDELKSNHRVKGEVIKQRISQMEISIEKIERNSDMSFDEFVKNDIAQDIVEYNLFIAITLLVDLAVDIVAGKGYGRLDARDEVFEILKEQELISQSKLEIYKKMIDQRNILEHQTRVINKKTIYEIATKNIIDIKKFILFAEEYY